MKAMNDVKKSRLTMAAAMLIFGTIGIFRRYIPLPSGMLAMFRGVIGTLFLLGVILAKGSKPNLKAIKANLALLCVSGAMIGFNWILLFEAYRYTSVAIATLCYYMAPIFVILVSPIFLKEKLTPKKAVCALVSLAGMVLVSGVLETGFTGAAELAGILFGLGAAVLYACVVIINKKIGEINAYDKTVMQLGSAAVVLIPYVLLAENVSEVSITPFSVIMLAVVGIVNTGLAYTLYFGSMKNLNAQTIALFSYIDPVTAIVLSAVLLGEGLDALELVGATLMLVSMAASELSFKKTP